MLAMGARLCSDCNHCVIVAPSAGHSLESHLCSPINVADLIDAASLASSGTILNAVARNASEDLTRSRAQVRVEHRSGRVGRLRMRRTDRTGSGASCRRWRHLDSTHATRVGSALRGASADGAAPHLAPHLPVHSDQPIDRHRSDG